jgi:hypothetical protein
MTNKYIDTATNHPLMRGLLIGGALGLMASWFGFPPGRSLILGFLAGLLAGFTRILINKQRQKGK